ncbi:MAG TPA: patatin-like phospholipase family protein, partial [Aestuariivirgaceae bacterium]|nr:patatin-like phospholipase family protein [Aestuariivirgaceae bacterium]
MRDLRIGLALGGGGARGLAHIAMIEAFDELGLKPAIIAGTSMGALIGAAYASGLEGRLIRDHAERVLANKVQLARLLFNPGDGHRIF